MWHRLNETLHLSTLAITSTLSGMTRKRTTERTLSDASFELMYSFTGSCTFMSLVLWIWLAPSWFVFFACFCFLHWWVTNPINALGGVCWLFAFGLRPRSVCFVVFVVPCFLRGWIRISDRGMCTSTLRKVYGFVYLPPPILYSLCRDNRYLCLGFLLLCLHSGPSLWA